MSKLKVFEDIAWENIEDLGMSKNNEKIERELIEQHNMNPNIASQLEIDGKENQKLNAFLKQIEGLDELLGGSHNTVGKYSEFYSANAKFLFENSQAL